MRVLFVCLGNICRSPAAEAIMQSVVEKAGLGGEIECDSAGTGAYHVGEKADPRMIEHARKRQIHITSIARQLSREDFDDFDFLIAMDQSNYQNMIRIAGDDRYSGKMHTMTGFCTKHRTDEVPDPYYGGHEGFEQVLNILEDACSGLLDFLKSRR
ncbi:MAG: low molecular weight phosphotyrosine protein phosphatase [Oligoflexales bacterium]|nr:low molecular weight phosphotyrosine protein phosphatase [Oligoflexales bacterium]